MVPQNGLEQLLQRGAGPVKACLDRAGGQFKKHRCFSGIVLFDVAEDENGTLPHGKLIDAATHELADLPTLEQCFEWY